MKNREGYQWLYREQRGSGGGVAEGARTKEEATVVTGGAKIAAGVNIGAPSSESNEGRFAVLRSEGAFHLLFWNNCK